MEVQRAHPGRFAIVKPVDPDDPAVGDIIADWEQTPGAVGIRIMMTKEAKREPNDPGLDRILRAAVKHDFNGVWRHPTLCRSYCSRDRGLNRAGIDVPLALGYLEDRGHGD